MDPIHPILPQPVNLPPILPASRLGRIDRDQRERRNPQQDEPEPDEREDDDLQGESHVDISA